MGKRDDVKSHCSCCILTKEIGGEDVDFCNLFSHCSVTKVNARAMLNDIEAALKDVVDNWNEKLIAEAKNAS